jgi:photosystem II stability/assembly factor-like uncharacterized protein
VNSPLGSNGVTDIHFISADTGYAIGSLSNLLIQSVDGGSTWGPVALPTVEETRVLLFVNNKIGIIGCDNGVILKTTDGGNTWSQTVNNDAALEDITAIEFASASVGFAGTSAGIILKTSNAGDTWDVNYDIKTSPVIPFAGIRSLAFANANVGYAGTSFTFIAKTTNAGGTIIIPTSVEEFNPLDQLLFYPNPSFGQVNINLKQDTQGHLQIFNWNGEMVYSVDINPYDQTIELPLSISSGIYLVNFKADDNIYSEKLIINRD